MDKGAFGPVAVLAVAGVLIALFRPHPPPPPKLVDVLAFEGDGENVRGLGPESTLSALEGLDFHVELDEPAYVYIFRVLGSSATLEWGLGEARLEKGVWAPDWQAASRGLHFAEGDTSLYVIAAPHPLTDADRWTAGDLMSPSTRCPTCSSASLTVHVARRQ